MIDLSKFWVQDGDVWRLVVGGKELAHCWADEDADEAKSAAEQAVSEWLYPVLQAVLGEPVAWLTDDGRTCTDEQKRGMPSAAKVSFAFPLYALPERTHD